VSDDPLRGAFVRCNESRGTRPKEEEYWREAFMRSGETEIFSKDSGREGSVLMPNSRPESGKTDELGYPPPSEMMPGMVRIFASSRIGDG